MNAHIKNYLDSFKLTKIYWQTLLTDTSAILFILLMWFSLGTLLSSRVYEITAGKTVEEFKAYMLSGSLEANQALLSSVKSFAVIFFVAVTLALILTLVIASLSGMIVWEKLFQHKKFAWKRLAGWCGLILLLLLVALLYLLLFGFLRVLLNLFTAVVSNYAYLLITRVIDYVVFLAFLVFTFFVFYSYSETGKVWQSVSHAFSLIGLRFSRLWKAFIFIAITGIVVGLLTSLAQRFMFSFPSWVFLLFSLCLFLLFLSWTRLYVLKVIGHGAEQTP